MPKMWIEELEIGQRVKIRGYGDGEHVVTGKKQDELGVWSVQLDGDVWYKMEYMKRR